MLLRPRRRWVLPASRSLRTFARAVLVAGAAGSIALMLRAGSRQRSTLLVFLFTVWVLSPFVALAVANLIAARWPDARRMALYGAMIGVSFISVSIYALDALRGPHAQAAFVYVVVPPACWLLIAIAFATAAVFAPKKTS